LSLEEALKACQLDIHSFSYSFVPSLNDMIYLFGKYVSNVFSIIHVSYFKCAAVCLINADDGRNLLSLTPEPG